MALPDKAQRKRWHILTLCLLLALALAACGETREEAGENTVYNVTQDGRVYTVDPVAQTITQNEEVYRYRIEGDTLTITYPEGGVDHYSYGYTSGALYTTGWVDTREGTLDPRGDTLRSVLEREWPPKPQETPPAQIRIEGLLGILLIAWGIWSARFPERAWEMGYGWRYKGAEPTEKALLFQRTGGIVFILIGSILLIYCIT